MIKSRRTKWAGHGALMEGKRNVYRILIRKPEGKRALGILRRTQVDNIKIDLRWKQWCGMDWINLAQDREQWRLLWAW
jgi:hypothetical protein